MVSILARKLRSLWLRIMSNRNNTAKITRHCGKDPVPALFDEEVVDEHFTWWEGRK